MNYKTVTVDVRADIRTGHEPFSKIMKAAAVLRQDEELLLIAPFKPMPLFDVLAKQGFSHTDRTTPSGDWEILFKRRAKAQPTEPAPPPAHNSSAETIQSNPPQIVEVDARGLEPPQPLVKILETVANLPWGSELRARTDRRPMHLYPHLEQRGFTTVTKEQPDGSFLTHIRRL